MYVRNCTEYERIYRFIHQLPRLMLGTEVVELDVLATLDNFFYLAYMSIAPFDCNPSQRQQGLWRCNRSGHFKMVERKEKHDDVDYDYRCLEEQLISDEFAAIESMIIDEYGLFYTRPYSLIYSRS